MPRATIRMKPARTRRRWLAISASAGSSLRVGAKRVDMRMGGALKGESLGS